MKTPAKQTYKPFYILWAALFALTAVLGFLFPNVEDPAGRLALQAITCIFFLPPWIILVRAKKAGDRKHVAIVRNLTMTSLALTVVLLCINLRSAGMSEALGNALNAALTVISAPLVCSNLYVLPLFLWGTLLAGAFSKK